MFPLMLRAVHQGSDPGYSTIVDFSIVGIIQHLLGPGSQHNFDFSKRQA